nr:type IV secretion system DNA-binding domain-containing protein [Fangia hongkongensis]
MLGFFSLPFTYYESLMHNIIMLTWGVCFLRSAYLDWRYQHRLSFIAPEVLRNQQIPLSTDSLANHPKKPDLYVGTGYDWTVKHRQLLYTLQSERSKVKNKWVNLIYDGKHRAYIDNFRVPTSFNPLRWRTHSKSLSDLRKKSQLLDSCLKSVGFPLIPDLAGKALYHGLEQFENYDIWVTESERAGHGCIIGTTGSGKTVCFNTLMAQDIRKGRLVIYLDPKGDLDTLVNMYCAAIDAGRVDDFMVIHAGQPELSAKANFFSNFSDVSQVADRMTSSLSQGGSGQNFTEEAWMAISQVAHALHEIGIKIDSASLRFYVSRPVELLRRYCEKIYPPLYPDFHSKVEKFTKDYINTAKKEKQELSKMQARNMAILKYVQLKQDELNDETSGVKIDHIGMSNRIDFDLYEISKNDEKHRRKMISSVFPLLSKINNTKQSSMFSYYNSDLIKKNDDGSYYQDEDGNCYKRQEYNVNEILDNPQRNKIIYVGISSLSNKTLSKTMVRAFLQDLTNCAGVLNDNGRQAGKDGKGAYIFIDEMAEVATESAIQLLNKSRGTGIRVVWATQTVSDLVDAFNGKKEKANQVLANSQGFKIIFRLKDKDLSEMIINMFDKVSVKGIEADSGVIDKSIHDFRTSNRDSVKTVETTLITDEMLTSLPNGNAMYINAQNVAYKVAFPRVVSDIDSYAEYVLSGDIYKDKNTKQGQDNIRFIMSQVNDVKISKEEADKYCNDDQVIVEKINNIDEKNDNTKSEESNKSSNKKISYSLSESDENSDTEDLIVLQDNMINEIDDDSSDDGFGDWDDWDENIDEHVTNDLDEKSINFEDVAINNNLDIKGENMSIENDILDKVDQSKCVDIESKNTLKSNGEIYTNNELNALQEHIIEMVNSGKYDRDILIDIDRFEVCLSFKFLREFSEKILNLDNVDLLIPSISVFITGKKKLRHIESNKSFWVTCIKYGNMQRMRSNLSSDNLDVMIRTYKEKFNVVELEASDNKTLR